MLRTTTKKGRQLFEVKSAPPEKILATPMACLDLGSCDYPNFKMIQARYVDFYLLRTNVTLHLPIAQLRKVGTSGGLQRMKQSIPALLSEFMGEIYQIN